MKSLGADYAPNRCPICDADNVTVRCTCKKGAASRESLAAAIAHVEAYVREHLPEGFTLSAEFRSNGVELKVQDDEFLCDELEAEEPGGVMELCQAANDEIAKEFPDDEDDEDSGISPDWNDTEDD